MTDEAAIFEKIEASHIQYIELWYTDITGRVKSITIPKRQLARVLRDGAHIDGSSLESFARVAESDMMLHPDLNTFAILPWASEEEPTARLICNVMAPTGDPFIGDPRATLIRVMEQAKEMHFVYKTGMELEFFLFDIHKTDLAQHRLHPMDTESYFDLPNDYGQLVRRRMLTALDTMNIQVLAAHHEIGHGQHEIDILYDNALTSADNLLTARVALRAVARQNGLHCTFMPRPSMSLPGSGMHTHQSLHHTSDDRNVFYDENNRYGLSDIALQFLAGQLRHARGMTAILAPLVNSYKRLGTSFEAPIHVTWAHINRAALIRIPGVRVGGEQHTRLELRLPDPSTNPYLAAAVMLQAGLEGIRQEMMQPEALEESILQQNRSRMRQVEVLPNSLRQALDALAEDDVILNALGPYISDRYLAAKRQEYDAYNRQVTQWELDNYFNQY